MKRNNQNQSPLENYDESKRLKQDQENAFIEDLKRINSAVNSNKNVIIDTDTDNSNHCKKSQQQEYNNDEQSENKMKETKNKRNQNRIWLPPSSLERKLPRVGTSYQATTLPPVHDKDSSTTNETDGNSTK